MNQAGDTVQFTASPTPSGSAIYAYCWDWWDGSSSATVAPFTTKVINIGGQPGTDELHFNCRPVAVDGQSVSLSGTITANNPPTILPGASISANDGFFTYQTRLTISAFDFDNDGCTFYWYTGTDLLGSGTTSIIGAVSGTWAGNGTIIVQNYTGTQNYLDLNVSSDHTVTCYVVDTRAGTSFVDFSLRGEDNPPPSVALSVGVGGVAFDAATPPTARIGAGQTVDLTVFVAPLPLHTVTFDWNFSGSNGWTMLPVAETGTTSVLANGGYQNTVRRDISTEVVTGGTTKLVTAQVRVTAINVLSSEITHTDAEYEITLVANSAPSAVTVTRSVNGVPVTGLGPITSGQQLEFAAAGTDVDADLMTYKWQITQPSPLFPNPIYFWGPKVVYDTTGYASLSSVEGQLSVIDRLGATLTVVLPSTSIA